MICFQVFDKYIGECIDDHEILLQSSEDPQVLLSSLLGIIWLGRKMFNNVTYISRNRKVMVMCLTQTMEKVGGLGMGAFCAIAPKDDPEYRKYAE